MARRVWPRLSGDQGRRARARPRSRVRGARERSARLRDPARRDRHAAPRQAPRSPDTGDEGEDAAPRRRGRGLSVCANAAPRGLRARARNPSDGAAGDRPRPDPLTMAPERAAEELAPLLLVALPRANAHALLAPRAKHPPSKKPQQKRSVPRAGNRIGDTWFFRSCPERRAETRRNESATAYGYYPRQMVQRKGWRAGLPSLGSERSEAPAEAVAHRANCSVATNSARDAL